MAVPTPKLTRRYENVHDYTDLPEITRQQIEHFFEHYKDLEPGKWVKVVGWGNAAEAEQMILEASSGRKQAKEVEPLPEERASHLRLRDALGRAGGLHRVVEQAGDGHRADAARHRRDGACHLLAGGIVAVAHELALAVALDAVDADVDDAWRRASASRP